MRALRVPSLPVALALGSVFPACPPAPKQQTTGTSGASSGPTGTDTSTTDAAPLPDCIAASDLGFIATLFPEISDPFAARGGALALNGTNELLVLDLRPGDLWRVSASQDTYVVQPPVPLGRGANTRIY